MRARILGSAAGGGLPQWNCGCDNCRAVRRDDPRVRARTQDSLALFRGEHAVVCNASPDIREQLAATPLLHPQAARGTPISAIVLTNGDLDHVLGLFSLRESEPIAIYATDSVRRGLVEHDAMCSTLARFRGQADWRRLPLDREIELADPQGSPTGISVRAFALPGKPPVHLAKLRASSAEDNVGLAIHGDGKELVYAPGCALPPRGLGDGADALLFDGTFWTSDELIRLGAGSARAEDMAHIPISGPEGSLALLARCTARRKIYTHINNTNPMLALGTRERREVVAAGWEIADDGMELS